MLSYQQLRSAILGLGGIHGWEGYFWGEHPQPSSDQTPLRVDVLVKNPRAATGIVVISGTHGIEGIPGSLLQQGLIENPDRLPGDIATIIIHALNPWGVDQRERTDHDNIDVNRGCWDGDTPPPDNQAYDQYRAVVEPREISEDWRLDFVKQNGGPAGLMTILRAVLAGQHHSPSGIFYGGTKPCWSAKVLKRICDAHLFSHFQRLAIIDLHTGLGPFGKGTILSPLFEADSPPAQRTRQWCGNTVEFPNARQAGVAAAVQGDLLNAMIRWLPQVEITATALEIGTIPPERSFPALIANNWFRCHPAEAAAPEYQDLRQRVRRVMETTFAPVDNDFWLGAAWSACRDLFDHLVAGLRQR